MTLNSRCQTKSYSTDLDPSSLPTVVYCWAAIAAAIFLGFSAFRYETLNATAYDLGIFDQAAYLISRGLPPISSYMGYHILGDHAALVWYPIALLYRLYPTVYWLLGLQAIALGSGVIPSFRLAQAAGLSRSLSGAVAIAYLLYPVIFNANLFDFHPDVFAVPLLLQALVEVQQHQSGSKSQLSQEVHWWKNGQFWRFFCCLLGILMCKAALSLTLLGLGFWLLIEKQWRFAGITLGFGAAWFWISSQWIVPNFSGKEAAAVGRYSYLGDSVLGIATALITQPQRITRVLLSYDNLGYLLLIFGPIGWAFSRSSLGILIGALPCLALNLLADYPMQKDVIHHYTLPAIPFFILMGITTLGQGQGWVRSRRAIIIWAIVGFAALAKFSYSWERYWPTLDTWRASRSAIAQVSPQTSVLATTGIATHLSHRPQIQTIANGMSRDRSSYSVYETVVINARHPGIQTSRETAQQLITTLQMDTAFTQTYAVDDVYIFQRKDLKPA